MRGQHSSSAQSRRGRDSASQSARASQPRPAARGPRRASSGRPLDNRGKNNFPAKTPADQHHFSFSTAEAYQCKSTNFLALQAGSDEERWFGGIAVEALDMYMHVCSASNLTPHKAIAAIIESIECAENQQEIMERTLNVEFVQCAQLTSNDNPLIRGRDPNIYDAHGNAQNTFEYQPDEEYENYVVEKHVGSSRNQQMQKVLMTAAQSECKHPAPTTWYYKQDHGRRWGGSQRPST